MMGPRSSSDGILREIFAGWPDVDCAYDPYAGRFMVRLTISDRYVEAVGLYGARSLVDQLKPRIGIKPPRVTGVRFKGRIVGRR